MKLNTDNILHFDLSLVRVREREKERVIESDRETSV